MTVAEAATVAPDGMLGRAPWMVRTTASSWLEGSRNRTEHWRPARTSAAGMLVATRTASSQTARFGLLRPKQN